MSEDTHVKALAAENARLRQQRDGLDDELLAEQKAHRAAIAEAAVLRHQDRYEDKLAAVIERMLPVVQGAVAWRRMFNRLVLSRRESLALWDAVDAYEKGPTEPPTSPLPADQPPVEDTATDGLEAQGGAQRAGAFLSPAWQVEFAATVQKWRRDLLGLWVVQGGPLELPEEFPITDAPRAPRVWNAGDPEPEGVEKVRGRHFLWRLTDRGWYDVNRHGEDVDGNHGVSWATWSWVLNDAPLTEVLPEPAAPTVTRAKARSCPTCHSIGARRAECNNLWHIEVRDLGNRHGFVATATAVPEAVRAGEAQTTTGMSEWIIAAGRAVDAYVGDGPKPPTALIIGLAVRAASPLIERAALHAAADELEATSPWLGYRWAAKALRDRATRTGGV